MEKHDPDELQIFVHGIARDTWQWSLKTGPSGKLPKLRSGIVAGTYQDAMEEGEQERLKLIYKGKLV